MTLKKGETYRCPDDDCGCEITVTKAPAGGEGGNPRCCCGMEMEMLHRDDPRRSSNRGDSRTETHHSR